MGADFLTKRGGVWAFQRRTPKEYAHLDPRPIYRASTKIKVADDRGGRRASIVADKLNRELEAFWQGLAQGRPREQLTGYTAARQRARQLGFDYVEHAALIQQPVEATLPRLEALAPHVNDTVSRAALLGTASRNVPMISEIYPTYEAEVQEYIMTLSPDQRRVFKNSRERAVNTFLKVVKHDKPVTEITHDDAMNFRDYHRERITQGVSLRTGNKQIGQLSAMLKEISLVRRLGLPNHFSGLRIKGDVDKDPTPYSPEFIQGSILAEGALDGLNEEARMVIYTIIDTGMRPSEILNLNEKSIFLDVPIPYVRVMADGRRLKTEHSDRLIPLVGCALPAVKIMRKGFKRYHDNPSGFSAVANKFLKENGLRPTGDHTVYSFRHSFKDRLIAAEAQDSMIDALMGHDANRPRYGNGPSLELRLKFLKRIAFKPPKSLAR